MKKELRWRAYYGFNPNEYYIVREKDIEKVKYAHIAKKIVVLDGNQINGQYIHRIEKDFRFYTGWNDGYSPKDAEDANQMKRDMPTDELEEREQLANDRVKYALQNNKVKELLENPRSLTIQSKGNNVIGIAQLVDKFKAQ